MPDLNPIEDGTDATRASLIERLRNVRDDASWFEFFKIYWRFIYARARQSGLSETEAQEVVQETLISVAKHMPTFRYDPAIGKFKSWLLVVTKRKITDQLRRREPQTIPPELEKDTPLGGNGTPAIADIHIVDPSEAEEKEWQANLVAAAIANLKRKLDGKKLQIFDFFVNKGWSAKQVGQTFKVSEDQVFQIKHRITEAIREEVQRLEREMI